MPDKTIPAFGDTQPPDMGEAWIEYGKSNECEEGDFGAFVAGWKAALRRHKCYGVLGQTEYCAECGVRFRG